MSPRLPPKSSMLTRGLMGRGGGGGGGGGGAALVPAEVASVPADGRPCAWGGHASARPPPNAASVASIESCCRCRKDKAAPAGSGSAPAPPAAPLPPEAAAAAPRAWGCGLRSTSSSEPPHRREVDPSLVAGGGAARLAPELHPYEHTGLCRTGGRLSDRPPENAPASGPACGGSVAPPGGGGMPPSGGGGCRVARTLRMMSWSRRSSSSLGGLLCTCATLLYAAQTEGAYNVSPSHIATVTRETAVTAAASSVTVNAEGGKCVIRGRLLSNQKHTVTLSPNRVSFGALSSTAASPTACCPRTRRRFGRSAPPPRR